MNGLGWAASGVAKSVFWCNENEDIEPVNQERLS